MRGGSFVVLVALGVLGTRLDAQTRTAPDAWSGLDLYMPGPAYEWNRPDVVGLGRRLFFDPALSRDSTRSCASCHRPEQGFADGNAVSVGVFGRRGTRNVPTIVNRGWGRSFFWDGRVRSLEVQVTEPITAPAEMDMTLEGVVQRLRGDATYRTHFQRVFGEPASPERLGQSLASYVRSIRAGGSRFDRAMEGDQSALSPIEQLGLELFRGRGRCARCHSGSLLTDESFHNTGVAWRVGVPSDSGRALVTGVPEDVGAFKTPTLRQIPLTAPYMHDGSLRTLVEVVDFYDGGGGSNPFLDPILRPLNLSPLEKHALLAFLETLLGEVDEGVP